jgi:hypothetical protein
VREATPHVDQLLLQPAVATAAEHQMDARRRGPGERLVFEPYSKQTFEQSFEWIEQHGIFPLNEMGSGNYEASIFS